jgi:hypothetical protein
MWLYKNKPFELKEEFIGFTYKITFNKKNHPLDGNYYIGCKRFYSKTTKSIGKKRIAQLTDKRKSKKETIIKESDWKNYKGSCKDIRYIELWEKYPDNFKKEILTIVKKEDYNLMYYEQKDMILNDWESEKCFNGNFNGKYFCNKIKEL